MNWILSLFTLLPLLFMGLIVWLIVVIVRRTSGGGGTAKSTEEQLNEVKMMEARVEQLKAELSPWGSNTAADLTSTMSFKSQRGMAQKLRGTIYGNDGAPLVAFYRVERGITTSGVLVAATSDFQVKYKYKGTEFAIKYNDVLLGRIRGTGELLDAEGNTIGMAKHPPKASVSVGMIKARTGSKTFPCELGGRQVATIRVSPDYSDRMSMDIAIGLNENSGMAPVLQMHDTPNQEEEKWLRALAILETAYHGHWLM